jgi:hypothetical protein
MLDFTGKFGYSTRHTNNRRQNVSGKRTPGKQVVEIDREVLKPWRDVARILGVSIEEYLEEFLADIGDCVDVLEEIADTSWRKRVEAERIAARLEKF